MRLHTASEVISLARRFEQDSADWYDQIAASGADPELMRSWSAENRRFAVQIERAYYGVISDAIEGGFAFDIEAGDFDLPSGIISGAGHSGHTRAAIETERMLVRFYTTAADQSGSLLADMPRVFRQIAGKRAARLQKLDTLLAGMA